MRLCIRVCICACACRSEYLEFVAERDAAAAAEAAAQRSAAAAGSSGGSSGAAASSSASGSVSSSGAAAAAGSKAEAEAPAKPPAAAPKKPRKMGFYEQEEYKKLQKVSRYACLEDFVPVARAWAERVRAESLHAGSQPACEAQRVSRVHRLPGYSTALMRGRGAPVLCAVRPPACRPHKTCNALVPVLCTVRRRSISSAPIATALTTRSSRWPRAARTWRR